MTCPYNTVSQNKGINGFQKLKRKRGTMKQDDALSPVLYEYDCGNGVFVRVKDDFARRYIDPFDPDSKISEKKRKYLFTGRTKAVLAFLLTIQAREKKPEITFTIREYAEARGMEPSRKAKEQLETEIEKLYQMTMSWSYMRYSPKTKKKEPKEYRWARLIPDYGWVDKKRKNIMRVQFGQCIIDDLAENGNGFFYYPENLLKLDTCQEVNAFSIGWGLCEYHHLNRRKEGYSHRVSFETLANWAYTVPEILEVKQKHREYFKCIYDPVINALNRLHEDCNLEWSWSLKNGEPVTEEQLRDMDIWAIYKNIFCNFEFLEIPNGRKKEETEETK